MTPIMSKDMLEKKSKDFDAISCYQKLMLGQKIGCDTVTHPKLFERTTQMTTDISDVKM